MCITYDVSEYQHHMYTNVILIDDVVVVVLVSFACVHVHTFYMYIHFEVKSFVLAHNTSTCTGSMHYIIQSVLSYVTHHSMYIGWSRIIILRTMSAYQGVLFMSITLTFVRERAFNQSMLPVLERYMILHMYITLVLYLLYNTVHCFYLFFLCF